MQLRLGCLAKTKWSGPKVLVKGLALMSVYTAKNPTLGCGVKARPVCRKFESGVFSMNTEWIATDAKIDSKGETITLSFKRVEDSKSHMNITLTADRWQRVMHLEWLLQEERKVTNHLAERNKEMWDENMGLRRSVIYTDNIETKYDKLDPKEASDE